MVNVIFILVILLCNCCNVGMNADPAHMLKEEKLRLKEKFQGLTGMDFDQVSTVANIMLKGLLNIVSSIAYGYLQRHIYAYLYLHT